MKLGSFLAVAGVAAFQGDGFVASEFNGLELRLLGFRALEFRVSLDLRCSFCTCYIFFLPRTCGSFRIKLLWPPRLAAGIRARVASRELDEVHWAIGFWGKPNTYNVYACCAMLSNFRIKAHG